MKQCINCNLKYSDSAKFCQSCGQELQIMQSTESEQKQENKIVKHKAATAALIEVISSTIILYGFSFIYTDFENLGFWLLVYFLSFALCIVLFSLAILNLMIFFKQKVITAQSVIACIFAFISLIFILLNFTYLSGNVQLYRQWKKVKDQGYGYNTNYEVQLIDYSK